MCPLFSQPTVSRTESERFRSGAQETFPQRGDMFTNMMLVREMRDEDARSFLEVHRAAVRHIAVLDYPPEVIEAWAPLPITQVDIDAVVSNRDKEIRYVAEYNGHLIGLACLVVAKNELRACYVAPEATRTGVGKTPSHED